MNKFEIKRAGLVPLLAGIAMVLCLTGAVQAGWVVETVDTDGVTGQATALVLSPSGEPHISYYDYFRRTLKYAYRDGTGWHIEFVEPGVNLIGERSDIALDPLGNPMIVYKGNYNPKFAYKNGPDWQAQFIDDSDTLWGEEPSIDVDSEGSPRISFSKGSMEVYHVFTDGGWWYAELVAENPGGYHQESEIQIDANDGVHVLFLDLSANGGTLRYAHGTAGSGWLIENAIVNIGYPGGGYMGMALSQDLYPQISYYDADDASVRFAQAENGWIPEIIEAGNAAKPWTSIAVDANGNPHIAYYFQDTTGGDLRYATKGAAGWSVQTVDSSSFNVGMYTSIALDGDGNPHISYYDDSQSFLKYAYFVPDTCAGTGVEISMPASVFRAGDPCSVTATVCNASGQALAGYPLFVILEIGAEYFFAPSFSQAFDNYAAMYPAFAPGSTIVTVLPSFTWPALGGSASGLTWYGALTNPAMTAVHGAFGWFTFGWE